MISGFSGLVGIYQRVWITFVDLDIEKQIKDLHLIQPGVNNIGFGFAIIQLYL